MSAIVERVARVLCECSGFDPDEPVVMLSKPSGKGFRWEFHEPTARAAIEAMRELSNSVHKAMCDAYDSPAAMWNAAIDEALK